MFLSEASEVCFFRSNFYEQDIWRSFTLAILRPNVGEAETGAKQSLVSFLFPSARPTERTRLFLELKASLSLSS